MPDQRGFVLDRNVAIMKVRERLAGLRGYPVRPEGEYLLAEALQVCAISMAHVDAVLADFDDECPTPRLIKDVAMGLRERYEPSIDQRKQWEAECGAPDPEWSRRLAFMASHSADFRAQLDELRLQSIRDALYYTEGQGSAKLDGPGKEKSADRKFWADAMSHHEREHPYELACIRAELAGTPLPPRPQTPLALPAPRTITQADIDKELLRRKTKERAGEEEEWRREEDEWRRRPEEEEE